MFKVTAQEGRRAGGHMVIVTTLSSLFDLLYCSTPQMRPTVSFFFSFFCLSGSTRFNNRLLARFA